jgi:hypothetical protein
MSVKLFRGHILHERIPARPAADGGSASGYVTRLEAPWQRVYFKTGTVKLTSTLGRSAGCNGRNRERTLRNPSNLQCPRHIGLILRAGTNVNGQWSDYLQQRACGDWE